MLASIELPSSDHHIIARFREEVFTELPDDLYIPPDALKVFLDTFEGPLDLLLYIIKKHNVDIVDIPIAAVTAQYMQYIDLMKDFRLALAGEYLLMAAMLAEIKSRILLPRPEIDCEDETDPRAELIRRLQEYERFKQAAEQLDELPREERDNFIVHITPPDMENAAPLPEVKLDELLDALRKMLKQADLVESHHIELEQLSIREKMTYVLDSLRVNAFLPFDSLFNFREGRLGVVVTFIAVLELLKQALIDIVQQDIFTPIHIKAVEAQAVEFQEVVES